MLDGLLREQVRNDPDIAGMLAVYGSKPAFFYQKSPADTDPKWQKPCYPRADYNIDMTYDPERKVSGAMTINAWCTAESAAMPEDIERRLIELISGTFYTGKDRATVCAVWRRSDSFDTNASANDVATAMPEVFGVTLQFDLLAFPEQLTTDPDPIQGLNNWTRENFPGMKVITLDDMPAVWKPSDWEPAIYWRFDATTANNQQSYATNWYTGQFAAHVIAENPADRNRWTKVIIEWLQLSGEVLLQDGSPLFANQIAVRHNADPLREGQLLFTGTYGVLAQHRKERAQQPLNQVSFTNPK